MKKVDQNFDFLKGLSFLILTLAFLFPAHLLAADCTLSPYAGKATLNEFFKDKTTQANDPDDFAEIKIVDGSITSSIYSTWKIQICERSVAANNNDEDGCNNDGMGNPIYVSVSNFSETNLPWLVLKDGTIGKYINLKTGFDAVLLDASNNVIDYVSVDSYNQAETNLGCTIAGLPYDFQASSPGASDKFIYRIPDGTGDWDSAPSASAPPSENDTNDEDPSGDPAPVISSTNQIVNKGQTALFTFTLTDAPKTYDVFVDYETRDATAVAGTDYIATSGTLTIPAGDLSATISVITIASSTSGIVYFDLFLSNQINATLESSFYTGTILANASNEWYMDETSWNETPNEVVNISGGNNGTAYKGLTTRPGYLCSAGEYDGSDDYLEIPDSVSLNGNNTLTYMAWIRPDTWSGGIRQIMGKSIHTAEAQMGIFSEAGVLKGRIVTIDNDPHEVTAVLPNLDTWTHVALVFNGYNLELYINGALTDVIFFPTTTLKQTTDPLILGKRNSPDEYFFDGKIDEVIVNQAALQPGLISSMYANYQLGLNWDGNTRSCSQIHHIQIEHDGTAILCKPESITIKACTTADCSTLYTGNVVVDLLPTGWIGGDQVTINNGSTDFELQILTPSTVTLSASNPAPTASENPVYTCINSGPNPTGNACNIEFFSSGFVFDVPTQTSCATSANVSIQALGTDPATSQCVPLFSGEKNLKAWSTYTNPIDGDTVGTPAIDLTNNLATTATQTLPTSSAPATDNIALNFDATATATFTVNYPDAGQLSLNMHFDGTGSEAGLTLLGSDEFVAVPAKLNVSNPDAASSCISGDATCSPYVAAGNNFNLNVSASCDNGTITPNFRVNGITLASNLIAPAAGINATLAVTSIDLVKADNGNHLLNTQAVNEVGVFTITATPPATYLGVPLTTAAGTSPNLGRFYPHHFDTTVANGCNTFTYSGQPFSVTAYAMNNAATPAITKNYFNTFAFDTTISNGAVNPIINFKDLLGNDSNIIAATSFLKGSGNKSNVAYTFPVKKTIPETIILRANDSDTGSAVGVVEGATKIRSGRARLENVFGPELTSLTMPLKIEFYSDNTFISDTSDDGFILNTDDSCTIYDATAGALTNYTGNLSTFETTVTGAGTVFAGTADITFSAPGSGNEGSVTLLLNGLSLVNQSPNWLTYNWNVDCDNADGDNDLTTGIDAGMCGPFGTASFGLYRGDDRIIYWREVF